MGLPNPGRKFLNRPGGRKSALCRSTSACIMGRCGACGWSAAGGVARAGRGMRFRNPERRCARICRRRTGRAASRSSETAAAPSAGGSSSRPGSCCASRGAATPSRQRDANVARAGSGSAAGDSLDEAGSRARHVTRGQGACSSETAPQGTTRCARRSWPRSHSGDTPSSRGPEYDLEPGVTHGDAPRLRSLAARDRARCRRQDPRSC